MPWLVSSTSTVLSIASAPIEFSERLSYLTKLTGSVYFISFLSLVLSLEPVSVFEFASTVALASLLTS